MLLALPFVFLFCLLYKVSLMTVDLSCYVLALSFVGPILVYPVI